jgi:hypothetical protein
MNLGNDLLQRLPMPQSERVRIAGRLADGRIAAGGTLIGPEEDILQEIGAKLRRNIGMLAASRETRLFTSSKGWRYAFDDGAISTRSLREQMPEYFESSAPYRLFIDREKPAKAVGEALAFLDARRKSAGEQQYLQDHKGTPF